MAFKHSSYFTIAAPNLNIAPILSGPGLVPVTPRSSVARRDAVERFATYFKRESEYDFFQYQATESDDDHVAFLFIEQVRHVVLGRTKPCCGACCFRWREWENAPHGWALQWVWLHPYFRGKGHLRAAWPIFRRLFGEFRPEHPLSKAMEAFLVKTRDVPPSGGDEVLALLAGTLRHPRFQGTP